MPAAEVRPVERRWSALTPSGLAEVRAFIRETLQPVATDEQIADLVQAVDELVCNVLEHGYRGSGPVTVAIVSDDETVVIRIGDAALPFDPRTVRAPRLDLPLEERPLGGMGIHLARTLTDRFDHRILPDGGNETTLTKLLRPAAAREIDDGHHDRTPES